MDTRKAFNTDGSKQSIIEILYHGVQKAEKDGNKLTKNNMFRMKRIEELYPNIKEVKQ